MPPTIEKANTGNPSLDTAIDAINGVRADFDARISALAESGGAVDIRIGKIEEERDAAAKKFEDIAERLASFDAPIDMDAKDKAKFSMGRCAQAVTASWENRNAVDNSENWEHAGFERDVLQTVDKQRDAQYAVLERAMGTVKEETGGVLMPSTVVADWIDLLRSNLVLQKLGARVMTNLIGHQIPITGMSQGASAAWYGESMTLTASELKFKRRFLNPHRVASFVPVAKNLLRWSPWAVEDIINTDMTAALARKIEEGVLIGAGTEHAPRGIVNDPDITTIALGPDANTGGRFSIRDVPDWEFELENSDLPIGDDAGFLFVPAVKRLLKKEGFEQFAGQGVDAGQPYVVPGVSDAALEGLLGYPFATTTALPTDLDKGTDTTTGFSHVFFALWRQVMVGQWGGIRLRASDQSGNADLGSAFLQDELWLVVETLADGLLRRPEALVLASDALRSV